MPELPTIAELGFPDYNVESWFALYAPAKTPSSVIATLNDKLRKWAASAEARDAMAAFGMTPEGSTPSYVQERYLREQKAFGPLVKAANIKAE
jgi:tripartite-type tricarboxylate transporter receptor subunit TctC